jgi:hypothetical protein
MSDQETFEDLLKSKLSEGEFSFDEENWEKAEDMIVSFRKKEKIKRGALLFFSGLLLGIIIMFPFLNKTENAGSKLISENNEPVVQSTTVSEKQNSSSSQGSFNSEKTHKEHKEKVKDQLGKPSISTNETSTPITVHNKKQHSGLTTEPVIKDIENKITAVNKDTESLTTVKEKINTEINRETEVVIAKDSATTTVASAKTDTIAIVAATDSILKDTVALVKKDSSFKSVSDKEKAATAFANPWQISVLAGGNYLMGRTLNPIQGFEFIKPIDSTWSVGTGLYYTYLNIKASNAVKTIVTSTTYDFGYTADVVQIKTNDLHYMIIPVFAHYHINEKNSVILGVNNYILLTVSNNYSTYKESYGNKQDVNSSKTFGYSSGFNRYDAGILLGYKRRLFNNVGLALYMNYGLMKLNKKDYYTDNTFEKNISGQLMITYRLH